jgi:hypothetical protein
MYSDKASSYREALHAEGRCVFESFKHSVTLQTVFRQIGENIEQVTFREALLRLRTLILQFLKTMIYLPLDSGISFHQTSELNLMMFSIFCQHMLLFWSSTVIN